MLCQHRDRISLIVTTTTTTRTARRLRQVARCFCLCDRSVEPRWSTCRCMVNPAPRGGEDSDACAHGERRNGPVRSRPPTASTRWRQVKRSTSQRAQKTDRAREAANRALRRQKSKAAGNAVFFELFEEEPGGGPAATSRRGATAGAGPEAHLGAHCRLRLLCSHGVDPQCSCAEDGGTAARHPPFLRHAHA